MFESNRELLTLCYDDLTEIRDGFYIVKLGRDLGVVDAGNNVIIPIDKEKIIKIANILFVSDRDNIFYTAYNVINFEEVGIDDYVDISKFSDNAFMVSNGNGEKGIINSRGEMILPCIYQSIWVSRRGSNKDYLKGRISLSIGTKYTGVLKADELSYIIIDKAYTKPDCLAAYETEISDLQIVLMDVQREQKKTGINTYTYDAKAKYSLRYMGKIVGKQFDDIMIRSALIQRGIVQTYNFNRETKKTTTGLQTITGEEIVDADTYNDVQYIGNGITVVKKEEGYGVVKNKVETVECGYANAISILHTIPITVLHRGSQQYYVGNDGKAYDKLQLAFPIYKSTLNNNVNLIDLYGKWLVVDNKLNRLINVDDMYKNIATYRKVE